MTTLEFTIDVGKNAEEFIIMPVGDDGTCDLPGAATPADPNKTLFDVGPGDYLLASGVRKRVLKVQKLE